MVKIFNKDGQETDILRDVIEITVSEERKGSRDYQSRGRFVSLKAAVRSENRTATGIRRCADELYAMIDVIFADRGETGSDGAGVEAADSESGASPAGGEEQINGLDPAMRVRYAPRAADRVPDQWWVVACTHYKLTAEKLELWDPDNQYPSATLYAKSPQWPTRWIGYMANDGSMQPFKRPVLVTQRISAKQNNRGYYYVDVVCLASPPANQAHGSASDFQPESATYHDGDYPDVEGEVEQDIF